MSENIGEIYRRYLDGTLTRVELDLLLKYFEQAPKEDLEKLIDTAFEQRPEAIADNRIDERLQRVQSNLIDHTLRIPVRPLWKQSWAAIAACILVVLGCYYLLQEKPLPVEDIAAPTHALFIKNAKGERIEIDGKTGTSLRAGNLQLSIVDTQTIRLSQAHDVTVVSEPHTFYTERSDFRILLEDGSIVTLNAHSSITLRTPFDADERVVSLVGEGFFDITHDAKRPFKVHTANTWIEVLGTQFNVKGYPEGDDVETVLVKGKVALSQDGKPGRVILAPGEKAVSNSDGIQLAKARTQQAIAWKDRYFSYEDQSLGKVLQEIAAWYGTELDTLNMPQGNRIYMKINKNLPLSEVLQLLHETSNLQYKFENGEISIQ